MSITSVKEIEAKVRELASKYPDAEYQTPDTACYYTQGRVRNGPEREGCLMGQALIELNPNEEEYLAHQDVGESVGIMDILGQMHDVPDDPETSRWLDRVQASQDGGQSWAEAIAHADEARRHEYE